MVVQIDEDSEELTFPDPRYGDEDGLFAVGGDLSIDRLILAYANGIFPWYDFREQKEILWWCPMKRFVIFPDKIHISHSMRTLLNKEKYSCSINQRFGDVIKQCSQLRINERGAWLGEDMIKAYTKLNRQGFVFSVEVWDDDTEQLVGGLYGVDMGNVFIGESMFSLVPSASKIALIYLAYFMRKVGRGKLIDCQIETPHLRSMGGRYISYDEYMKIMNEEE